MIRKGGPDPQTEAEARAASEQQRLEDTLLDAAHELGRIRAEWPLVVALGDSRQAGLGFVPADVRERLGAAYAQEKQERRARSSDPARGLGASAGEAQPLGVGRTPGNIGAWSLSAELALMLRDWIRRVVADHRASGASLRGIAIVAGTLPAEPSDRQILDHLRELLWTITKIGRARALVADLQHYADRIRDFLDGDHRRELPGACPWCHRRTLVLYQESGVIRCEGPRGADGYAVPCTCNNGACGCHEDPAWTHTWLDAHASHQATSWDALARLLASGPAAAPVAQVSTTAAHLIRKYGKGTR